MTRWWVAVILLLVLPLQALAQAARVTSGDHTDFTRIVVEFAGPVDWKMGRTADGYELRLPESGTQYDLTKAFDLIQKDRLASIFADPQTGALRLGIACACFAIPFEFRPATVVIDIRNGPPPEGSSFEEPLDASSAMAVAETAAAPPMPQGDQPRYDWTVLAMPPQPEQHAMPSPDLVAAVQKPAATPMDLEPLRQSLIEQLSRGASAGIVDMAKPKRADPGSDQVDANPSVALRLGDQPNLTLRQKGEPDAPMTAEGAACFSDEQVDIASWSVAAAGPRVAEMAPAGEGDAAHAEKPAPTAEGHQAAPTTIEPIDHPLEKEVPISMQFGPAMANLTGEFDRPDPVAVRRAVRFDLFVGFGAEARGLMRALPVHDEDQPIWESMARIIDEETDPEPAFSGMEACDTGAALWAILADPKVLGVGQVQKSAILRAFSALPTHLRNHFGPVLVDRFLAMADFGTATALRDAVTRGNASAGPEIEMMQAAIDKASGSPGASVARLESVAKGSGPSSADALAALVQQRAELGQDVSYDQVRAIEEYAKERQGSEDHDKFQHALTLAYAASGDFDKAYANLANSPDAAATLWQLLGNSGPDSAVLNHATLDSGQKPPRAAKASASLMVDRMLRLGFADQAAQWLAAANDPPLLLAARVAVAQGAPQKGLDILGEQKSPPAIQVRLDALRQLGDDPAIAKLFADLGMTEDHWNAVSRMQDWQTLAADGPDVWKAAAATVADPPAMAAPAASDAGPPKGPLAMGQALVNESATTRDAITALLASVKSPAVPSQ